MRCAVIDPASGAVLNVIVADPDDTPPAGATLVGLADDQPVDERCTWTVCGWVYPPAPAAEPDPPPEYDADGKVIAT